MFRPSQRKRLMLTTALGSALLAGIAGAPAVADDDDHGARTATPIKHVIVLIGENRSLDNVFGMYKPRHGSISNLLSKGIVNSSGMTVLNTQAQQYFIKTPYPTSYFIDFHATNGKSLYPILPQPNTAYIPQTAGPLSQGQAPFDSTDVPDSLLPTLEPSIEPEDLGLLRTGASGLPMFTEDTRITNASSLPNGSFQITNASSVPYDSYTGDMVHRLFHMWQQSDCSVANATADNPSGCLNDLYPFTGVARNDGSGSNAMGFYNVNNGDAPVLKRLADEYTLNDNYHQPVMGGTMVQHTILGTADFIPWDTFNGQSAPPAGAVANPNPQSTTNVAFTADKTWTNCSDTTQPGIAPIVSYLATLPWHPAPNCAAGRFYGINNMSPGFLPNGVVDTANIVTGSKIPPSSLRTIGDALNEKGISWAYFGGGYDAAVRVANGSTVPSDELIAANYCDICNPFSYASSIMGNSAQRAAHIKDAIDFFNDLNHGTLPSVSYVKPDSLVDGHPASSKLDLFEAMLDNIVDKLKAHPELFESTALFVTFDEGGGYYDSGFMQPLDFFGDGPRIPTIVVSPYSRGGNVVHSYNDHTSIVKFIERNWGLRPLTARSRDNLPNPHMNPSHPYVPLNMPAVGDMFDMFDFDHDDHDHADRDHDRDDRDHDDHDRG
jgi:phospholipase C